MRGAPRLITTGHLVGRVQHATKGPVRNATALTIEGPHRLTGRHGTGQRVSSRALAGLVRKQIAGCAKGNEIDVLALFDRRLKHAAPGQAEASTEAVRGELAIEAAYEVPTAVGLASSKHLLRPHELDVLLSSCTDMSWTAVDGAAAQSMQGPSCSRACLLRKLLHLW